MDYLEYLTRWCTIRTLTRVNESFDALKCDIAYDMPTMCYPKRKH